MKEVLKELFGEVSMKKKWGIFIVLALLIIGLLTLGIMSSSCSMRPQHNEDNPVEHQEKSFWPWNKK